MRVKTSAQPAEVRRRITMSPYCAGRYSFVLESSTFSTPTIFSIRPAMARASSSLSSGMLLSSMSSAFFSTSSTSVFKNSSRAPSGKTAPG